MKKVVTKLKKDDKEKDDNNLILELTLKKRDMEIKTVNEEHQAEKLLEHQPDHILKCDECAYSSETEIALKKHMKTEHEVQCTSCRNSFAGNKKLKNHICKVHVENPTYKEYYMKEWFERDKCIRVFNNNKKEEVIILHSEDCTDISKCADLPENIKDEKWVRDTHGLRISYCMKDKCIRLETSIAFYYKAKWAA